MGVVCIKGGSGTKGGTRTQQEQQNNEERVAVAADNNDKEDFFHRQPFDPNTAAADITAKHPTQRPNVWYDDSTEIRFQAAASGPHHHHHVRESPVVVRHEPPQTMQQIHGAEIVSGVSPVVPQCTSQTVLSQPPPSNPLGMMEETEGVLPDWKDVVHDTEDRVVVIVPSMTRRPSSSNADRISPLPLHLQRLTSQRSLSNTLAADSSSFAGSGASPSQANSSRAFPMQLLRDRNSTSTLNSPDASQSASQGGAALFAASVSAVSSGADPSLFHIRPSVGSGAGGGSSNASSSHSSGGDKSTLVLSDSALERHRLEILGVRSLSSLPTTVVAAVSNSSLHHCRSGAPLLEIPIGLLFENDRTTSSHRQCVSNEGPEGKTTPISQGFPLVMLVAVDGEGDPVSERRD